MEFESNEFINVKNLKTQFKRVCNNYIIKNNDKLFNKKKLRHKMDNGKYETIIEEFYIPTVEGLNNLLYEYHSKSCHSNYKDLKALFYQNKIGYIGMDLVLEEYVNNCPVCVQTSKTDHRLDPVISIYVDGPDTRYVFDITYLNEDMAICFRTKYLLCIIDTFSRKSMVNGTNDKEVNTLLIL